MASTTQAPAHNLVLRVMPYSEVCMHMQVAGKEMYVEDVGHRMAQLYEVLPGPFSWDKLRKFSFPICWGEAGITGDRWPDE